MRNVIKSLFRRENILVLLLVLGALLGLVGVPQMYGVTSDQIILALLAVLAVDALVEKLGYLDRIETQITDLESKIEPRLSADDVIRSREEMPPFTSWLEKGDEIWLAGKSLHGLITAYGRQIELAANSGTRFRVLLVNPDNSSLMGVYAAGSLGQPTAMSADQLSRTALALFVSLRDNTPQGAVEVRLIDYVPSNTYLIVDG